MCVLTFVSDHQNGFILTNNRDENLKRPNALAPQKYIIGQQSVYLPKDPKGGGTWIATNSKYTLCLLNGAFQKHISTGNYIKSRGQVILDFYQHQNIELLKEDKYFDGIENFTLILIEPNEERISEIIWDGSKSYFIDLVWQNSYIWSSCTLYSDEIIKQRRIAFNEFLLENPTPNQKQLFDFHKFTDLGDVQNNLVMERSDGTITQCICQINRQGTATRFSYNDLITGQEKSLIII